MAKVLRAGQPSGGRRADVTVLNFTLPSEAAALLRQYAGAGKKLGELVARLIYTHHARQLERQQIREQMVLVLSEKQE